MSPNFRRCYRDFFPWLIHFRNSILRRWMRKRLRQRQESLGTLGDDGKGRVLSGKGMDNHQQLPQQLNPLLRFKSAMNFVQSSRMMRCSGFRYLIFIIMSEKNSLIII
jgi:hypothetical protein